MNYILLKELSTQVKRKEEHFSSSICQYIQAHQNHRAREISYLSFCLLKQYVLLLYQIDMTDLLLACNEHGRPQFREFDFNISHSGNLLAIGISKEKIGVDIQQITHFQKQEQLAKKILDNGSLQQYLLEKTPQAFIREFAKKEAYLKYLGTGFDASYIQTIKPEFCRTLSVQDATGNDYILACCCQNQQFELLYVKEKDFR